MPLTFEELHSKGFLGLLDSSSSSSSYYNISANREDLLCYNNGGFSAPISDLDSSTLVSSSTTTLSSSHGGPSGGGGAAAYGKCDKTGFEDFDGVLSGSPRKDHSVLSLIMAPGSGFVGFVPGFVSDPVIDNPGSLFGYDFPFHEPPEEEDEEEKLQITTNPETMLNQNPIFYSVMSSPPSKRLNSGQPGSQNHHQWAFPFSDPGMDPFLPPPKLAGIEAYSDQSTVIINQLFNAAAELIGITNGGDKNPLLAQEILARLNHYISNNNPKPPFQRAALYIAETLQSLLLHDSPPSLLPPQSLILRIAAYKAFSETSPFLQFVNFTANQTILECVESFDKIHIVDFDIGYGGQWSSLIQELAGKRRSASAPSLKITAFASPSTISDEFELRFTEENLRSFAAEIGVSFEIELLNVEILLNPTSWPLSLLRSSSDKEAIAVNLPISSVVSGYIPSILSFLKQVSPNVVVCSDRSCDRNTDAPFPNYVIHALHYYTSLLESMESNIQEEAVATSVERFCVQPSIEKLLRNRYRWLERSLPWRSLFGQCGFSSATISQTAETQAEYLLQRNPMRGYHLDKRHSSSSSSSSSSSLVLCWQKKELVTVSAWKC
ncbi:unnamed protein product [Cochlearia groenlandica]